MRGATPPPAFLKALQACRSKEASCHQHICNEGWLYRSFCLRMGVGLHPRLDARCGNTNHLFAAGGAGGRGAPPQPPAFFQFHPCLTSVHHFRSFHSFHDCHHVVTVFHRHMHRVSSVSVTFQQLPCLARIFQRFSSCFIVAIIFIRFHHIS